MNAPSNLTAWERWELASFEDAHPQPVAERAPAAAPPSDEEDLARVKLPTAAEIEQIHQQARDEGYRKGFEEGLQAGTEQGMREGQAHIDAEAQRLAAAADKLDQALEALDEKIAADVLALAIELAREVIRQEISAHPESLLAAVREALTFLPHQHAAIYLHPEDASLLRSYLGDQLSHAGHRIHEDFKLQRGDCILEAGGSQLDATVAMRWQRVVEGLGIASAWHPSGDAARQSADES